MGLTELLAWACACVCIFRYFGRTQKQLSEYVRENCVKRPPFQRYSTYLIMHDSGLSGTSLHSNRNNEKTSYVRRFIARRHAASRCVCVCRAAYIIYLLHTVLVLAAKVMCCIQCFLVSSSVGGDIPFLSCSSSARPCIRVCIPKHC